MMILDFASAYFEIAVPRFKAVQSVPGVELAIKAGAEGSDPGVYLRGLPPDVLASLSASTYAVHTWYASLDTEESEEIERPFTTHDKMLAFVRAVDAELRERLPDNRDIQTEPASVTGDSRSWHWVIHAGMICLQVVEPRKVGMLTPVCAAVIDELAKARQAFAGARMKFNEDETLTTVQNSVGQSLLGDFMTLGKYNASPWEIKRRQMERQQFRDESMTAKDWENVPVKIPPKHLDPDSLADWYRWHVDTGPFEIIRVSSVNHRLVEGAKPRRNGDRADVTQHVFSPMPNKRDTCGVCGLRKSDHTWDNVVVIQLKRNVTEHEARDYLGPLEKFTADDGIDGLMFVDTPNQYRIGESDEQPST